MTPREIIAEAWAITRKERHLRRWGIASAFFETLRDVELLLYQAYFTYWYIKGVSVGWFSVEMVFLEHLPFWLFVTITAILIILIPLELFVPTIATGSIIGLAAKAKKGEEVRGGLVLGLYNFFAILEVHGLFVLSGATTLITAVSMIIRYAGEGTFRYWIVGAVVFLWIVGSLFHFLASFAEEAIVIRKRGVFGAVSESFKLIISHSSHIMFLLLLLFVITLRIIINAVMVLLIPGIAVGLAFLLALFLSPVISYVIAGFVGILLILGASYFFAYLHVFKQTVWTLTYMELSSRKELDVIDL
jgi:hypothetical protein